MKKLEAVVNYFILTDTVNLVKEIEVPKSEVAYSEAGGIFRFYNKSNRDKIGSHSGYPIGLTSATGSVTLDTGVAGSVDGITVNAVQIMSGAVAFITDLPTTAQAVADNINAFTSSPNYIAAAVGNVITITSVVTGSAVNGFAVVTTATTITKTDVAMAGAAANLVDTGDAPFADIAAVLTFLRANTGA